MKLLRFFVVLLTFHLFLLGELQLPDKHPLDETETKTFELENGLKVILVSNPKYNISVSKSNWWISIFVFFSSLLSVLFLGIW